MATVSPANPVGISDTNVVGYFDYNRSSPGSIRSQPNGRTSRDRSYRGLADIIIGHLLVDLVLVKEGPLDVTEVPATLKVIGVIGALVAVVVQDTDILGTTVNLQILTVIPLLSNMLGQGVVIEREGRVLIFPRLQLILGIRIGTHAYISLSVWPESMSGPQGRKVKD